MNTILDASAAVAPKIPRQTSPLLIELGAGGVGGGTASTCLYPRRDAAAYNAVSFEERSPSGETRNFQIALVSARESVGGKFPSRPVERRWLPRQRRWNFCSDELPARDSEILKKIALYGIFIPPTLRAMNSQANLLTGASFPGELTAR